jgi:hypothetical protein
MIFPYELVRLLQQQRLEEALRKERRLRMIREAERARRLRQGRLATSLARRLLLLLTHRPTVSSRGCAPPVQRNATRVACVDGRPDELSCRAV